MKTIHNKLIRDKIPKTIKGNKKTKVQVSLAGEFSVLSQLALQGKDANMTLGNTKGVDILVSDPVTGKMLKLEVKTNYNNKKIIRSKTFGNFLNSWILNKKNEKYDKKKDVNLFYCFVNIHKKTEHFRFYIVPAKIVANYLILQHKLIHRERKKEGRELKMSNIRNFRIGIKEEVYKISTPLAEKYEDNWDFKAK